MSRPCWGSASHEGATCVHDSRHKQRHRSPDARPRPHTHSERGFGCSGRSESPPSLIQDTEPILMGCWVRDAVVRCMRARTGEAWVWCTCAFAAAAARGQAGSITISISADQPEAPSNPGLSPGSHTPQLGLILPSSLLAAEQQRTVCVCLYMGVLCGCRGQLVDFVLGVEICPLKPPGDHWAVGLWDNADTHKLEIWRVTNWPKWWRYKQLFDQWPHNWL